MTTESIDHPSMEIPGPQVFGLVSQGNGQQRDGQRARPVNLNQARLGLAIKLVFNSWGYTVAALREKARLRERFMADIFTLYDIFQKTYEIIKTRGGNGE